MRAERKDRLSARSRFRFLDFLPARIEDTLHPAGRYFYYQLQFRSAGGGIAKGQAELRFS
jgi:hypothetical protein